MKVSTATIAMCILVGLSAITCVSAQPPVRGCVLDYQDHYRCNRDEFQRRLAAAQAIRVDTDRLDLFAAKRVREMLQSLGKTVVEQGQRPDLIFDLAPVDRSGRVDLSPAEVALATLTVYDPANGTGNRSRVWVETFDGQTDRPWPSVVIDLLKKFQKDALTH